MPSTSYAGTYARLHQLYPKDRGCLIVPYPNVPVEDGITVLIDWSNIHIGFVDYYRHTQRLWSLPVDPDCDMDFILLDLVLVRGRKWRTKLICGSQFSRLERIVLRDAKRLCYQITMLDRVSNEKLGYGYRERGVDETLCGAIEAALRDVCAPSTLVLATGDGQPTSSDYTLGFFGCVEKALKAGWTVELNSFGSSLSSNWFELKNLFPKSFCIVYLDEFASSMAQVRR